MALMSTIRFPVNGSCAATKGAMGVAESGSKNKSHVLRSTFTPKLIGDRDFYGLFGKDFASCFKLSISSRPYHLVPVRAKNRNWYRKRYNHAPEEAIDKIVRTLCKSGDSAESILNKLGYIIKPPDWFNVLEGVGRRRYWQRSLEVFRWIQSQRWYTPDNGYYAKLISIMGKERQYRLAMWLFAETRKTGCRPDTSLYNSLMGVHLRSPDKSKGFEKALALLEDMKSKKSCQPNVVTYNILVRAAAQIGKDDTVRYLFRDMFSREIPVDLYTFNGILDAYGQAGKLFEMEDALKWMREVPLVPDAVTFNILINSYGKAQEFAKMEEVLARMCDRRRGINLVPNVKTYNSMITNYGNAGKWEKAEQIFEDMQKEKVFPTSVTYEALLSAYGISGLFSKMDEVVQEMMDLGPRPQASTLNQMVAAYCRHGRPGEAESLLRSAIERVGVYPTSLSHGILIRHYKETGNIARIPPLLDQMKEWGLSPTKQIHVDVLECLGLRLNDGPDNKSSAEDGEGAGAKAFEADSDSDEGANYMGVVAEMSV